MPGLDLGTLNWYARPLATKPPLSLEETREYFSYIAGYIHSSLVSKGNLWPRMITDDPR